MASALTSLKHDLDTYHENLQRSTYSLNYRLDPTESINCNTCFAPNGSFGDQRAVREKQIDVDSVLKGLSKKNSKSNAKQMSHFPIAGKNIPLRDCSNALETEYTRYTNPSYDIKGLTTSDMRFGYPLHDPQCNIFQNFEVNTRLQSKDNYRAVWQTPFDQRSAFPQEKINPRKKCNIIFNCN